MLHDFVASNVPASAFKLYQKECKSKTSPMARDNFFVQMLIAEKYIQLQ